jgi:hypothetical protein
MEKFLSFPLTGSTTQLVSATGIAIIEQASAITTTIAYKAGNSSGDIITITHASVSNDDFRDFVQKQVVAALQKPWTEPVLEVVPPVAVSGIALA